MFHIHFVINQKTPLVRVSPFCFVKDYLFKHQQQVPLFTTYATKSGAG